MENRDKEYSAPTIDIKVIGKEDLLVVSEPFEDSNNGDPIDWWSDDTFFMP